MEKNRRYKLFVIGILVFTIFGVSIGFAAFSTTLSISSIASVKPSSDGFSIVLSTNSTSVVTDSVKAEVVGTGVNAKDATITGSSLSGVYANFTKPGQSAIYTLYAINTGEYDAYLNSIQIASKECILGDNVDFTLGNAACDSIDVSVKVGNAAEIKGSSLEMFSGHKLLAGSSEVIEVTISYSEDGGWADGSFAVILGQISLEYSSTDLYSGNANLTYSMGDSIMYDPVNNTTCSIGDTCYEWNVIEHSYASSNDVTLITTDVMNSLYYEAYSLSEDSFVNAGLGQLLDATSTWSVGARHLTETEYNSIIAYYGCSWPEWLGMSCSYDNSYDKIHWFYSKNYFFLEGNKWVGYDGGGSGAVHYYSTAMDSIGVRPVIIIPKSKLI